MFIPSLIGTQRKLGRILSCVEILSLRSSSWSIFFLNSSCSIIVYFPICNNGIVSRSFRAMITVKYVLIIHRPESNILTDFWFYFIGFLNIKLICNITLILATLFRIFVHSLGFFFFNLLHN